MSRTVFIAIWPVTELAPLDDLASIAGRELPAIAARAHARIVGKPRWSIRAGADVPGSGGVQHVLHCVAPAVHVPRKAVEHEQRRGAAA